jgi:hypothetical protein
MLVSPFHDTWVQIPSPKLDQGRVDLLVQVCAPCAPADCSYAIDGIRVADFCTPEYLELVPAEPQSVDYTKALSGALDVVLGGYLFWHDPVGRHLWRYERGAESPYQDQGFFAHRSDAAAALKRVGYYGSSSA